jgi:transcriptional regulator of acetoin/glycerol metabolism
MCRAGRDVVERCTLTLMPAPRTPVTRKFYDKLLEAYRQTPGNASAAARRLGIDRRMASRGWSTGWVNHPWARPIRDVLAEEAQAARIRAAQLERSVEDTDRDRAKQEAIEQKAAELQLLKAARHDVLGLLASVADLTNTVRLLAQHASKIILQGLEGYTAEQAMALVERHARITSRAIAATESVIRLSREAQGQPGSIIGVAVVDDLTYEQALLDVAWRGTWTSVSWESLWSSTQRALDRGGGYPRGGRESA